MFIGIVLIGFFVGKLIDWIMCIGEIKWLIVLKVGVFVVVEL